MVKSGKLRSGSGSKLKRWKKGHSSDSNPQTSRHRHAAKSRFFSRPSGQSDLTVDALKLHNELQTGPLEIKTASQKDAFMVDEPDQAVSERTSGTFLSGLSDCSNLTFRKVQRFWESNSAAHKEICAVLAAVTEVIRSQGGKETETEYFAALMTTLEAVDSEESQAAVAYLLNLTMKRVPAPVLVSKFSDTTKALMDIISQQASSERSSSLRWILSCLATLLRKQDVTVWTYPSTLQVYHGLVSFTVHSKPKVRKAAQQGVCAIIRGSDFMFAEKAPAHHPAAASTAKFCIKEMEQAGGSREDTTTLHVLGLLKELMSSFPLGPVKSCCEMLLRVMTLSHVLVTASAMQTFHRLFSGKPNASTLSPELNAQIITALYDYLPSENDLQPLLAWLAVMEKAHIHLACLQSSLSLGHMPRLFSAAMSCLLSPHVQVVSAAASMLKTLLTECVGPRMEEIGMVSATASTGNPSYVYKMFRIVEEGLSYRFHASWPFVLQILGCFYKVAGKEAHPVMTKSLQSLADLRATPRFPYSGELDLAVGGAVQSMGPETVLRVVPLNITGYDDDLEFPRSWLVPVIRDHVKNTRLGFFTSYFLPLASTLKQRCTSEHLSQAKCILNVMSSCYTIKNTPGQCVVMFRFDLVKSMLPLGYCKVLVNIRKTEARNKRKKHAATQQEDSDSEEEAPKANSIEDILAGSDSDRQDEGKAGRKSSGGKQQKGRAWLKEGEEDDPLNFLDPKVSQRVLATNPEKKKSAKAAHDFKVTPDGRLIIKEEDGEDDQTDDAEMKDIQEEAGVKRKKVQKGNLRDDNYDDMDTEPHLKYKGEQPLPLVLFNDLCIQHHEMMMIQTSIALGTIYSSLWKQSITTEMNTWFNVKPNCQQQNYLSGINQSEN
ncbi:LOW QUALITY PROTEIN: RRP12-like protein [Syngnathus typhle]